VVKPKRGKIARQMLTIDEVATSLKVSRRTIYRCIKSGKLSALKFDGFYRIEGAAYEDFLDRARTNSALVDSREEAKV